MGNLFLLVPPFCRDFSSSTQLSSPCTIVFSFTACVWVPICEGDKYIIFVLVVLIPSEGCYTEPGPYWLWGSVNLYSQICSETSRSIRVVYHSAVLCPGASNTSVIAIVVWSSFSVTFRLSTDFHVLICWRLIKAELFWHCDCCRRTVASTRIDCREICASV